jgi:hypothetical protein
MKRLLLSLLALPLLSGCGGGVTDLKPILIGTWRVRSFSVENGQTQVCPSALPAGNFFTGCAANSTFVFRGDGTVIDPAGLPHSYNRSRLHLTYFTPAQTETELVFSGANDEILTWTQAKTDILPAVAITLERVN